MYEWLQINDRCLSNERLYSIIGAIIITLGFYTIYDVGKMERTKRGSKQWS